jgi:cell division protein FtsB
MGSDSAMSFGREVKRRLRGGIAPALFLALTFYFCWNAVQGPHGLKSYAAQQIVLKQAQADLAIAQAERDAWQRRVYALESDHLDRDMLDERARALLNLANPNDIIVQYGPKDRLY